MPMTQAFTVLLDDLPVGTLRTDARDGCEFSLLRSFRDARPRPTLGQYFLDDLEHVDHVRLGVPPWFANLLPEGALRELIAEQADVHPARELYLLALLGEDLPGAVRIRGAVGEAPEAINPPAAADDKAPLKFSLAGIQLKFSARRDQRGLTIPAHGMGGDWIIKLPDRRYPQVPRNELATMRWAELSGIEVPRNELIPIANIKGLPGSVQDLAESDAFIIKRFDRPSPGRRMHIEDLAQVLSLPPRDKYKHCNYETLANLMLNIVGVEGLESFLRRLVFVIASGNGDAHLKNWSLIYPDGIGAQVAPAYDQISTLAYMNGDSLALNLGKSKDWQRIDRATFVRLAERLRPSLEIDLPVPDMIDAAVEDIMSAWTTIERGREYPPKIADAIRAHLRRVPLLRA